MSRASRFIRALLMLTMLSGVVAMFSATTATAATTLKPKQGGSATITATWTTFDPSLSGFGNLTQNPGYDIFDSLVIALSNGAPAGSGPIQPDLATSWAYSDGLKTLTLQLRHGVKFQDGTPFNAAAVQWNILRDKVGTNISAQDMTAISGVTTKGNYTVVVHLSVPDSNLIWVFAAEPAGMMISPTAFQSEGAQQFGIMPIGAGGFKVTADNPSVSATLSAWPGYWNQKHRYLTTINVLESPQLEGDTVEYNDVQSGALSVFFDSATGTPSVLAGAKSNPGVGYLRGKSLAIEFLVLNTNKPPFNNQTAREALDYCMNRQAITQDVYSGYPTPAYVFTARNTSYQPSYGSKPPPGFYNFNPSQGKALIASLGGLSFNFMIGSTPSALATAEAVGQQWTTNCGINVNYTPTSTPAEVQNEVTGAYQIFETETGGVTNPFLGVSEYSLPTSSVNKFGLSNATITNLINATGYTTTTSALSGIWERVFNLEAKLAAPIPLYATTNYYIYTKNLKGITYLANNTILSNAYYT
jgi:peptide/nickel transport system substrate-binding protein